MPGKLYTTSNFTSAQAAAAELLAQAQPARGAVAFLVCDAMMDGAALAAAVSAGMDMPLVGAGSMLLPAIYGSETLSAALTVFSSPGLRVAVAASQVLDEARCGQQMDEVYRRCVDTLGAPPKLLVAYLPMPGVMADPFANRLFSLAGQVPLFGGMATGDLEARPAQVFSDGQAHTDRLVLLALGGDIRPVFAMGCQLTPMAEYAPAVTQATGALVERVDNMTFCEYMRSLGISPETRTSGVEALTQYGPLPVRLRGKGDDDGVPELRCLNYTDLETGSAAFSSVLPVGTRVSMGLIHKSDVLESSARSTEELLSRMAPAQAEGYRYSLLLAVPCVARYYAMLGDTDMEAGSMRECLPEGMVPSCYYGFYEIGPTYGAGGEIHNRSNNASLVLCAI